MGETADDYTGLFETENLDYKAKTGLMGTAKIVLPTAKKQFVFKDGKPILIHTWFVSTYDF